MDRGHELTDELIERLTNEMDAVYAQAYKEMLAKQKKYMAEYEKALAKKREELKAGKIKQDQFDAWKRQQLINAEWHKQMVKALAEDLTKTDGKALSVTGSYEKDAYALNHDFGTFQVESGGMVDTSYTLYDRDAVERLIAERPNLLPDVKLDEGKDKRWNQQHFTSAITQSILQGESIPQTAARLRQVIGMGRNSAVRAARTAMTGAENAGRIDSYKRAKAMGIGMKKEWLATLDKRTRDSHARLDGERVDIEDKFSNGLKYPGDPNGRGSEVYNCRCTLVPVLDGIDQSDAPRNSKLGDMSYDEWKRGEWRSAKDQKSRAGKSAKAVRTSYTMKELGDMNRDKLVTIAREVARKNAGKNGISEDEALRRFDLLVSSNTTAQIRKYINRNGK